MVISNGFLVQLPVRRPAETFRAGTAKPHTARGATPGRTDCGPRRTFLALPAARHSGTEM
jgi:hypothetical protein